GGTWITTLTHGVYYLPNGGIYQIVDNHRWKSITTNSNAVWVGSDFRAIGRYDGHRFTYKQYPVESVRDILIKEDNLWLADFNGLGIINIESDKMTGRIENFTTQMVLKRDGGIVGVGISKDELRVWQVDATAATNSIDYVPWKFRVLCAAMGPGDTLMLGTTHGIRLLDLSTKESWAHSSYPMLNSRVEDIAYVGGDTLIAATGSDGVWLLTDRKRLALDPGGKTLSKS
ncbi:MAG: hypothetical protein AAGB22_03105, partial [Bacteroidota bacterium]